MDAKRIQEIFGGHYVPPWSILTIGKAILVRMSGNARWMFSVTTRALSDSDGNGAVVSDEFGPSFESQEVAEHARQELIQWVHSWATNQKTEEVKMRHPVDFQAMVDELTRHEGFRSKPYLCAAGKMTIGIGRNLEDNGITEDEARYLALNDVSAVVQELTLAGDWWLGAPEPCREVLVNMGFNLGVPRLLGFRKMLAAMRAGKWETAADEMLDSLWANQVGPRAVELAEKIRRLSTKES